jgi:hypothetical protein
VKGSVVGSFLLAALLFWGCDRSYEARFTLVQDASEDRDPAADADQLIAALKSQFSLSCRGPEVWTGPPSSTHEPETHYECSARPDRTRIGIVAGDGQVVVHLSKLGRLSEPRGFRAIRLATERHLLQARARGKLYAEYPYEQ